MLKRLRPLDRVLLLTLVPLWGVYSALHVKGGYSAGALVRYIEVARGSSANDYPVVALIGEDPDLRVGDRLVRIGTVDLRGAGSLETLARAFTQLGYDLPVEIVLERAGERHEFTKSFRALRFPWTGALVSLFFAAGCVFLLLRAPPSRQVRALFLAGMCFSISLVPIALPSPSLALACVEIGISYFFFLLVCLFVLRAVLIFPEEVAPHGRLALALPWLFPVAFASLLAWGELEAASRILGSRPGWAWASLLALYLATGLGVIARNYRRSSPIGRRQIRWIAFGFYVGLAPPIVINALFILAPGLLWFDEMMAAVVAAALAIPMGVVIAVVRHNLFDIDRLISATASYSLLVVVLALGGEVLFEPLAARAASFVGLDPGAGQVAFVVLLAAVLIPAQRAWRPYVDRVFFAEGRSVGESVEELLTEISHATGAPAVTQRTGDGIERAFHPEFCVIYEHAGKFFEPRYVFGSGEFTSIPADEQSVLTLETKVTPIRLDSRGTTPSSAGRIDWLVPGAAVILPLRSQVAPNAFVAIGPKRSGDVYTSTDLSLLSAVAYAASARHTFAIRESSPVKVADGR